MDLWDGYAGEMSEAEAICPPWTSVSTLSFTCGGQELKGRGPGRRVCTCTCVCEDAQEAPHQHPAARVAGVGPTHDHGVVHLLDDRDEVVTLQLREGGRDG